MNRWIEAGRELLQSPDLPVQEKGLMEIHLGQMEQSFARLQVVQLGPSLTDEQLEETIVRLPGEAREALKRNHAFFTIRPESLGQLLVKYREFFGYVNPSEHLRALAPRQAFEAAIPVDAKGRAATLPKSNNLPFDIQDVMNQEYAEKLSIAGIKSVTGTISIYSQADIQQQTDGRGKLIVGFYARTGDETVAPVVAFVGRIYAGAPLGVGGWRRGLGHDDVRALPVVVPAQLEI